MDYSALHPLVLQLLDPEQASAASPGSSEAGRTQPGRDAAPDDSLATVTVSGAAYHVTSAEVDLVLTQEGGGGETNEPGDTTDTTTTTTTTQAARLLLTLRPAQRPTSRTTRGARVAAHVVVRRRRPRRPRHDDDDAPPGPAAEVALVVLDADALARPDAPAPQRASAVAPAAPARGGAPAPLAETYRAYVAAINARAVPMARSLPRFCLGTVAHNGRALPLAGYRRLMEDAQAAVPDITFGVADLLVDEARGLVGARLEFRGTPAGEFAGVRPPVVEEGAGGREVRFGEVVFYWFEDGKIREVVSLVDVDSYRAQVRG